MSDNPFQILGGEPIREVNKTADLEAQIKEIIGSSNIVVFMKGTPDMPMCGFSANTVAMLNNLNVQFKTFNILEDMDIREGLKEYSNWPTYPQLYFKGELVGGNDIITEMFHSGDLESTLKA